MNEVCKVSRHTSNQVIFKKVKRNDLRDIVAIDAVPVIETRVSFEPVVIKAPIIAFQIGVECF
jgi:hypothetical protein